MPKINIRKVDCPLCEHCGKSIGDSVYCEITTANNKVIKMHQFCAIDFAVSILEEYGKDINCKDTIKETIVDLHKRLRES